ncbi:MAG: HEAT repeat domain-containing protein [Planctomycetes bacterium]|nr:HEAT repeat domain-containing protein [Planctomycetota bacterium]
MNRTIIISLGIACALVSAAGIMWYNNPKELDIDNILNSCKSTSDVRELLNHKDPRVIHRAIVILSKSLKDKESIHKIRELLNDREVNAEAINALVNLNDNESIPKIREFLNNKDAYLLIQAIYALGELKDTASIPEIIKLLKQKPHGLIELEDIIVVNYAEVRETAEEALKKLGVPEAEIERAKSK